MNTLNVYYSGTEEEWGEIDIQSQLDNKPLINAAIHYNSNGFPAPVIEDTINITDNNDGTYTVDAVLSDIHYNCTIIAVLYNQEGMTGIGSEKVVPYDTSKSIDITADSAESVKVFLWDSLNGIKPLCESKTINIEQ